LTPLDGQYETGVKELVHLKFVSIKQYYSLLPGAGTLSSNLTLQQQSLYSQNLSETNSNKATFQIEDS
jgi:hypothetical protein